MSLTVMPANNNSWQNQLINFVSPLLTDWIKSAREAEINRKNNAAAAEILRSVGLGDNPNNLPPSLTNNNLSSNGWENAFRSQSDNPLATFDANTADIAPNLNQGNPASLNPSNSQSMPTLADFQRAMTQHLGTRRFGMVNPENLQKIMNPFLTAYEANRIEGLRNNLADTLRDAKDEAERRNAAWGGYAQGLMPIEGLNAAVAEYNRAHPDLQPMSYNAGGENHLYSFNNRTGEYIPGQVIPNSLTPQQVQAGDQWNRTFDENQRQFDAQQTLRERQQDFLEKQALWVREHPEYARYTDSQGRLWGLKPGDNNAVPVTGPDGQQLIGEPNMYFGSTGGTARGYRTNPSSTSGMSEADKNYINYRRNLIKGLQEERRTLEISQRNAGTTEEKERLQNRINEIDNQINQYNSEINAREAKYNQPNQQNNTQSSQQPNQQNNTQSSQQPNQQNNTQPSQQPNQQNSNPVDENAIVYYHPKKNQKMTAGDLRRQKEKAALGQLFDPASRRFIPFHEVEEWMQSDGWVKGDGSNLNPTVSAAPQVDPNQDWRPSYQRVGSSPALTSPVVLTPRLSDEERERAQIQGSTGASIARGNEQNNVDTALNGEKNNQNNNSESESNSEVMWENPDGRTISVSEYNNRLRMSGMENPDYDAWLEAQGFRRVANSNTQAPLITDVVNGTTPTAMQAQVAHLNGDDSNTMDNNLIPMADRARTPLDTLFNFMSESPSVNEAIRQKYPNDNRFENLLPFVRNPDTNSPDENGNDYHTDNDLPPNDYNPYDPNYPQPQPYSPDDPYERGFEFDDEDNTQNNSNDDFQMLPLVNYDNNDNNMTLLAARRNSRRKNQRRTTRVTPQRRNYPQRTARRPGQIRPNTSYEQLRNEVDSSARRHGVDPELIRAIVQIESRWDSNALSSAGARGLMQLMPGTAKDMGVRDSYNPAQNIEGGTKYIARLIRMYKGDVSKALMAYNCGPGNVNKGCIPSVTRKYARDVMAIYNRLLAQRRG